MKKNIIISIVVCIVFFVLILIIRNNNHTIERQENELANERCKYEYSDLEDSRMSIKNLIDKSWYLYSVWYSTSLWHCIARESYNDDNYPRRIFYKIEDLQNWEVLFKCDFIEGVDKNCSWDMYNQKIIELWRFWYDWKGGINNKKEG